VRRARIAAFPGSFDPLTVAHVAIADAAFEQLELARLDMVLSAVALDKEHGGHAPVGERAALIGAVARDGRPWLHARVTSDRLIADIATGYDACVMGADKWHQLFDPAYYDGSITARDAALARLPLLAVAPRGDLPLPGGSAVILDLAAEHQQVSSTAVRSGRHDWRA
jgi:hypothetical protein